MAWSLQGHRANRNVFGKRPKATSMGWRSGCGQEFRNEKTKQECLKRR